MSEAKNDRNNTGPNRLEKQKSEKLDGKGPRGGCMSNKGKKSGKK